MNVRNKLYYKKNLNTDEEKNEAYKEIIAVTGQIETIRKKLDFVMKLRKVYQWLKMRLKNWKNKKKMVKNKKKERGDNR